MIFRSNRKHFILFTLLGKATAAHLRALALHLPRVVAAMASQHQNCRFYENKYPEVDDVVMVEVRTYAVSMSLFSFTV